jgi:hypothetical protein
MYVVPNMAVLCSSLTSWFPGILLTYFLNDFEMVPVAQIITGITLVFTCIIIIIIIVIPAAAAAIVVAAIILFVLVVSCHKSSLPSTSPLEITVTPPHRLYYSARHGASSGCGWRNDLQCGRVSEI